MKRNIGNQARKKEIETHIQKTSEKFMKYLQDNPEDTLTVRIFGSGIERGYIQINRIN